MVCLLQCDPAHTVSGPHIVECSAEGKKFRPSPQSSKCVPLPKSSAGFLAEASTSCAPPAEVAAEVAAGIDPTIEDTEEEANSNLNTSEDIKDEEDTEEEANSNLNTAVDASSDLEVGDGEEDNNVKNISKESEEANTSEDTKDEEDTKEEADSNLSTVEDTKDGRKKADSNLNTAVDASSDLEVGDGEEDNNVKNISKESEVAKIKVETQAGDQPTEDKEVREDKTKIPLFTYEEDVAGENDEVDEEDSESNDIKLESYEAMMGELLEDVRDSNDKGRQEINKTRTTSNIDKVEIDCENYKKTSS